MFAGRQQEGPHTEVGLRMGIYGLGGVGLLAYGLHVAYAAVWLQGGSGQVVPCFFDDGFVGVTVEQSVVHAPEHAVGEEGRAAGLRARSVGFAQHRPAPVAARALYTGHTLGQLAETLGEESTMLVVPRHVSQHLGQSGQHPAVAACPETLAAVAGCLYLRPYILGIAVVELLVFVEHQRVAPAEIVVEFV